MRKSLVAGVLILSLLGFMGLKLKLDTIARNKVPGASILYLPSGKFLKYASFGNSPLMADMIFLWAIQYFSNTDIAGRFIHLDHVFAIISELDPQYLDPYQIGALIAIYDAGDIWKAFRILDRGLEKNPDQWIFPMEAGHYAGMLIKNFELARQYYKKAMDIEGAPPIARRLYANTALQMTDYPTALRSWTEVYETAETERIRKIASNQLYRIRATMDIQVIRRALESYRDTHGRWPRSLDRLVQAGLLRSLPHDPDGKDYAYDPETGKVSAAQWWKR